MLPEKALVLKPFRNCIVIDVKDQTDDEQYLSYLIGLKSVITAERCRILFNTGFVPDDPLYGEQWHLPKMSLPRTWQHFRGNPDIIVSAFESGDLSHPDLAPSFWNNLGEDANGNGATMIQYSDGTWGFDAEDVNGIDDDGNGYIDDFIGWDFIERMCSHASISSCEDCDYQDFDPSDYCGMGHGSHCAGIMAAASNNGIGVSGIDMMAKIAVLRTDFAYDATWGMHGDTVQVLPMRATAMQW